ncbi:hypothetical protein SUGI_0519140 [Cryptomeria japonica]|nr:hypothetical protein SUGI_0519140 [Cryptomeria japonica]
MATKLSRMVMRSFSSYGGGTPGLRVYCSRVVIVHGDSFWLDSRKAFVRAESNMTSVSHVVGKEKVELEQSEKKGVGEGRVRAE